MAIEWHEIEGSKQVTKVGYDPATNILEVVFKSGGHYRYPDVPMSRWEALMERRANGGSIGSFLHTDIKPHYDFEKL